MQDVDKNEGDDLVMKNGPQSIKVLVMDHTNDKTLDDERVQTWSKEPSIVVKPIVKRNTDCEESDRGQRRPIHQSDAIPTRDGDGQKQSRNQSDKIARDEEERRVQHEEDVYLQTKASSSISTIQVCTEGDQS